jgi:hypothetical protein
MQINYFDINIIDLEENNTVLSLEKTVLAGPRLVYNGADDKFTNIVTSELNFAFHVSDNSEGKYLDLFSGKETRFKVQLIDSSVAGFPKIVWQGFLLPEQYSEPYIHSNFLVSFTATDGIGLLKGKAYNNAGATAQTSVLNVISKCLLLTGLSQPILFTEAVQNAAFNLDYLDLQVNTAAYYDTEGVIDDAYSVLEKCVKSIGAQLFLYNGFWYVIGLNKQKETTFSFKKYTLDASNNLQFDSAVSYTRELFNAPFYASPEVTILPTLKTVNTIFERGDQKSLLPEDVVNHKPLNLATDTSDRTVKYWQVKNTKAITTEISMAVVAANVLQYYNGYIATPNEYREEQTNMPGVQVSQTETITLTDLATNYITLENPFFVYGSDDLEKYGTLEIELKAALDGITKTTEDLSTYFNNQGTIESIANDGAGGVRITSANHGLFTGDQIIVSSVKYEGAFYILRHSANQFDITIAYNGVDVGTWAINPFKGLFHFAITYRQHLTGADEVIYLSNFTSADFPDRFFDYKLSLDGQFVKGSLLLDKILFLNDGYYNIRLYPVVANVLLDDFCIYKELKLEQNREKELTFSQTRNIDFSETKEVSLFHSSSREKISNRSFLFSDAFIASVGGSQSAPGVLLVQPVSYEIRNRKLNNTTFYEQVTVVLNSTDYTNLIGVYDLYVLKSGDSVLTPILEENYTLTADNGQFKLQQKIFEDSVFAYVEATDTIYLKGADVAVNLQYADYWLDKFKRYDIQESKQFYEVLNCMYHDLLHEYNFVINGSVQGLLGPLDIVQFSFKGLKNYYPVRLSIDLNSGITETTLVELKNKEVTDYAE